MKCPKCGYANLEALAKNLRAETARLRKFNEAIGTPETRITLLVVEALTQAFERTVESAALCGTYDIESIEMAFFNHDSRGEPQPGQWEKRREQWRSFKDYLAAHRTVTGEDRPKPRKDA